MRGLILYTWITFQRSSSKSYYSLITFLSQVTVPCGNPTEFLITGSGGVEHLLQAENSVEDITQWVPDCFKDLENMLLFSLYVASDVAKLDWVLLHFSFFLFLFFVSVANRLGWNIKISYPSFLTHFLLFWTEIGWGGKILFVTPFICWEVEMIGWDGKIGLVTFSTFIFIFLTKSDYRENLCKEFVVTRHLGRYCEKLYILYPINLHGIRTFSTRNVYQTK